MSASDQSQVDVAFHADRAGSYDDDVAAEYAVYDALVLEPLLDRIAAATPGAAALDLGCGTGAVTARLASRGFRVTAVDHSPAMIDVAREKLAAAGLESAVDFRVAEITTLPFADGSFDVVTCQRVLHHVPGADRAVAEVRRVLKPDGTFYLSDSVTNTSRWLRTARELWHRVTRRRSPSADIDEFLDEHEVQRSASDLYRLLGEAGLERQDAVFFNHVGLRDVLPPRLRRLVIRALSFPGRRRSGDLIFITAKSS
jgi:ubiquinone/menaquinone biosynthesis C-methylase UbiE